jgi:peptide/nickel transport system permease protein
MWTTVGVGIIVCFDQFISAWSPGRTIATIGPQTPNLTGPFWFRMIDYAGHQILPSLALALIGFATFMRFTRSSMLETLKSDYVRTAKAKGLPGTQVIMRHAFRTALIPVMTVVTISIATIIEGAVITERVFAWQGMGSLFIDGLNDVDPYPVMGFLLVTSIVIIFMNAVADIMYAYLDPRIRR